MPDYAHLELFSSKLFFLCEIGCVAFYSQFLEQLRDCVLRTVGDAAIVTSVFSTEMAVVIVASRIFECKSVGHIRQLKLLLILG